MHIAFHLLPWKSLTKIILTPQTACKRPLCDTIGEQMLPCLANKLHTPKSPPTKITNSKNFMWTSAFAFTGHEILYDSFRVLYPLFTIKAPASHSNHLLRNQRAAKKQCPLLIMSLISSAQQRVLSLLTTEWLLFKSTILFFFIIRRSLRDHFPSVHPWHESCRSG